jgi:hypothetical protein
MTNRHAPVRLTVTPAKAGVQTGPVGAPSNALWIPAFAGMTKETRPLGVGARRERPGRPAGCRI